MTASTYDVEESLPHRSRISQIATTVFLGIPMTLALVIGLVFYCSYECLKFALSSKPQNPQTPVSDEQDFTKALTNFASVHTPAKPVNVPVPEKSSEIHTQ